MIDDYEKKPIIIIPAYCPDEKLLNLIWEIREKVEFPIIVVDDGSGKEYENVFMLAEKINNCLIFHNEVNMGKGAALKNGVKYAMIKYPYNSGYITCDADGQHKAEDILAVAKELIENKNCLILGVRDFSLDNVPKKSRIGNLISSIGFYFITGTKCYDTQTGLRGIQREHEDILLSVPGDRYEFEMNFLITVSKMKKEIREVNIKTIYIDENKSSHYRPLKDSLLIFSGLLKYTISSLLSAIIDLGIFTILNITIFKYISFGLLISTIVARVCSGVVNFTLNQKWVFNGNKTVGEAIKYAILFITQMIASGLLVTVITPVLLNATVAKILVDSILFILSYIIQKNIIFRKKQNNDKKEVHIIND
ncbi:MULTISPECIES: bifunctional glycosyltransferase family 2/GtrA family protein [unclassified Clostridium]|uniref:bifunctional glycosyltransferase family 2/GtrA family protein n=1 Tax=unclassified Clostridium TaxID=2614128 RepID=UPI0025C0C925|nr:bifunctional glycosyltransferase family 2/GtrA family protein [Clostridium sp.]MDY4253652.1 bifunctional glycosyltransferase family 2/GtrA family protein [Clostridium sp.]